MKRLFCLTLLILVVSVTPTEAQRIRFYNPNSCGGIPVGPWYQYWPLEAHFQLPASPQYPYWPAPMTLPNAAGMGGYNPYGGTGGFYPYGGTGGYGGGSPYPPVPQRPAPGGAIPPQAPPARPG